MVYYKRMFANLILLFWSGIRIFTILSSNIS